MKDILSEEEKDEVVELTKDLMKIPSSVWDDESIYSYVFKYLQDKNLDPKKWNKDEYSLDKSTPFFNILSEYGNGKGPKILINGHLDTATAKSKWFYSKFLAKEVEGKIYRLGAADMKLGCAIAISVYEKMKRITDELQKYQSTDNLA